MTRLLRWAFNFAAAVSALLFVATCILWVLSYRKSNNPVAIHFWAGPELWEVFARRGVFWADNEPQREMDRLPVRMIEARIAKLRHIELEEKDLSDRLTVEVYRRPNWRTDDGGLFKKSADALARSREARDMQSPYRQMLQEMDPQSYLFRYRPRTVPAVRVTPLRSHAVSFGAVLTALALLPAGRLAGAAVHFWCRRRRWIHGRCPSCGYDLRATPDRCPECGAFPKGKAAT